jgi:hypothetical protein
MDKKDFVYIGIGLFFLLVLHSSTKQPNMKQFQEVDVNSDLESKKLSFSSGSLPFFLKPPARIDEKEGIQPEKPRNLNALNGVEFMPKFDL